MHRIGRHQGGPHADTFARPLSEHELPKWRIPEETSDPRVAYEIVRDELALDGNASQNLATFCTTWSDTETRKLMDDAMSKNLVDKDEYPQTAAIESRCVHILGDLWNAPRDADAMGCSTTGSSEAAMLAGLAMKWRWRQAREKAGKSTERPNLVCGPVQVCWEKFARYFDVELRQVPLRAAATGLEPDQLSDYVDENTIGVVAILGVTFTCSYEPVATIGAALDAIQDKTGLDIPIHVDAASGGFVAPFLRPDLEWDFRVPRVASINSSGHKFGMAPLGVGWVVWRSGDLLPEGLVFHVDYLGGNLPTFALTFSRPGSQVIAQYFTLLRLGRRGYTDVQQACSDTAQWLGHHIAEAGPFEMLYDGHGALPAVSYRLKDGHDEFSLYELSDQLRMRGWQVPTYQLPPDRQDTMIQRILIRHGTSRDTAALLLDDIRRSIKQLTRPQPHHQGFHH